MKPLTPWGCYPNCPDCRANIWRLGPRGGASTNIECAACGHKFNMALGGMLIQRIGDPEPPREDR